MALLGVDKKRKKNGRKLKEQVFLGIFALLKAW